jgi:uncharacterized membrane protein (TIGR02234 family)
MVETPRRTSVSRAGLMLAAVGCVVAGGVALLAAGREWVRFTVAQPPLPDLHSGASGHVVAGAVAPLGVVILAGVVAFPATRNIGRRIAGALVALAGIGLVVVALQVAVSPGDSVAREAAHLTGRTGVRPSSAGLTAWPWIAFCAGLIAIAAGVLATLFANRWPAMGRRYESGITRKGRDETSMWDQLDRGDDPTA